MPVVRATYMTLSGPMTLGNNLGNSTPALHLHSVIRAAGLSKDKWAKVEL